MSPKARNWIVRYRLLPHGVGVPLRMLLTIPKEAFDYKQELIERNRIYRRKRNLFLTFVKPTGRLLIVERRINPGRQGNSHYYVVDARRNSHAYANPTILESLDEARDELHKLAAQLTSM